MSLKPPKAVHVISFDIPFPADYGGVIDVYYKIKALVERGIKVHLHAYEYGRKEQDVLENLCTSVSYYPRQAGRQNLFLRKPYIVASRSSEALLKRLSKDNYPILFEGLHSTFHLPEKAIEKRIKIVRTHNIEHDYYQNLAEVESNVFKRYYFYNEASKLKKYERVLKHATHIAAISPKDHSYFQRKYKNSALVPAFHAYEEVCSKPGLGKFALYHGNLGVGENNEAALYLCKKVFPHVKYPVKIAGNKASKELKEEVDKLDHVELVCPVNQSQIQNLLETAHINMLPTFQATGIKLKLLAALYSGRHVVVNAPMVKKTGLEKLCHIAQDPAAFIEAMKNLTSIEFTEKEVQERKAVLTGTYSNAASLTSLIPLFVSNQ